MLISRVCNMLLISNLIIYQQHCNYLTISKLIVSRETQIFEYQLNNAYICFERIKYI